MPNTKTLIIRGLLVFLALLLSSSVCFFGYLQKVPDSRYSGIRSMNASDFNANGAWLRQALDGKFIFRNPYTSEKQTPFLIRPFYSAISLPFRWANLSSSVILHFWRLIFSIILLASLFPLIKVFEKNQNRINIAFLLLAFTSGAGYFFHKIVPGSADLGLPEAFLFLTLGEAPHFQYSILLFWVAVAALFLYGENRQSALWVFLVCLGLLWWDHPFDAITLTALSSLGLWLYTGWRKKIIFFSLAFLVSLPPVLYYVWLTKLPYAQGAAEQNVLPSPEFSPFAIAFLPLILLATAGVIHKIKNREQKRVLIFLVAWILIQFGLAYSPVPFQRRLISGVQFPLAILAAVGLAEKVRKPILIAAIVLILSSTNFYVMKKEIQELQSRTMPFYLPKAYINAFQWLSNQNNDGSVLSAFVTANFVPAHTGLTSYWGHSQLTPRSPEKRLAVERFYQSPNSEFIRQNNIRYIFLAWEERIYKLPKLDPPFSIVYDRQQIRIYELKGE